MDKLNCYRNNARNLHNECQENDKWQKESWIGYLFGSLILFPWRFSYANREEKLLHKWVKLVRSEGYTPAPDIDKALLENLKTSHQALYGSAGLRKMHRLSQEILNGVTYCEIETKQRVKEKPLSTKETVNAMIKALQDSTDPIDKSILKRYEGYQKQLQGGESVTLPHYFHGTKPKNFQQILKDNRIHTSHMGTFPGAWVSELPEKKYGAYVIAFTSDSIAKDDEVSEYSGKANGKAKHLWIGRNKDLKLKKESVAYLAVEKPEAYSQAPFKVIHIDEARQEGELLLNIRPHLVPARWEIGKV